MGRVLTLPIAASLFCIGAAASAEAVVGLWASPPDGKGQTGIVQVSPCGAGYCGTLIKAFDLQGEQIVTANVGKQLIWDMQSNGDGTYSNGRAFVPLFGKDFPATMTLNGKVLEVKGCAAGICKSQVWKRVQ